MTSSIPSNESKGIHSADSNITVSNIQHSGDNGEFVIIGKQKFYKHELMSAFGGTLNPGLAPYPSHEIANPAPMGLAAFSLTTFVLSMYNAGAMGVHVPNVVVGLACFYGGGVQLLAGVFELISSNTFGGCALTSYGCFWLSYAAINVESFGIASAYTDEKELGNAIGFFLLAWALFTFMLTLCTLKSTVFFCALFSCLTLTFIMLAAGEFTGSANCQKAGGIIGVITAFLGFYNAFAGTANKTNSYFTAYPIPLTRQ